MGRDGQGKGKTKDKKGIERKEANAEEGH